MTMPATIKYAIYPGTVTLYDGTDIEISAEELATLYGVEDEDYLVIESAIEVPQGQEYFEYIHLKPRKDGVYSNIMTEAQDDGEVITMGEDFDGNKTYVQETDPNNIDKDIDLPHN